jgi:thiamine-monophosphate kinase
MTANMAMGPGGEFDIIRMMIASWGETAEGIGSDAAILVLPPACRLVVTTDASVENVHFRRDWFEPRAIGYRATIAALSDLAAAAAKPMFVLVTVAVPERWLPDLPSLAEGIGEAVSRHGARIVGGDTSRSADLLLSITALGAAENPVTRSGAAIGDAVYVTGDLGRSGAALAKLLAGVRPDESEWTRLAAPATRCSEAIWLAAQGISAAVDISDGLGTELGHLASASQVRLRIDLDRVPAASGIDPMRAMSSGEEYELLFTAPRAAPVRELPKEFLCPVTRIGDVVEGEPGVELSARGTVIAPPSGYNHFST